MESWKIVVLKHDDASEEIGSFFKKVWSDGIIEKNIGEVNTAKKEEIAEKIGEAIGELEGKILTLYGKGDFHHYTYGLCKVASHKSKSYIYLHADHHTDASYNNANTLGCGAFVKHILKDLGAKDVLLIGPVYPENGLKPKVIPEDILISRKAKKELRKILKEKKQKDAYLSSDLDLLAKEEVSTNYARGELRLKHLLDVIEVTKEEKNIISADILGYANQDMHSPPVSPPVSLLAYATLAAKITGKDTKELENLHSYFKNNYPITHKGCNDFVAAQKEFERITDKLRI